MKEKSLFDKYYDKIGRVVYMAVYDCFAGDVKILSVNAGAVYIEIVRAYACYSQCQQDPELGSRYWIEEREIADVFEDTEMPF